MGANTVKVDRSTKWGNPFKVGEMVVHPKTGRRKFVASVDDAVELFKIFLDTARGAEIAAAARRELGGKNLACWCKVGSVCHGDVLLQVANPVKIIKQAA